MRKIILIGGIGVGRSIAATQHKLLKALDDIELITMDDIQKMEAGRKEKIESMLEAVPPPIPKIPYIAPMTVESRPILPAGANYIAGNKTKRNRKWKQ